MTACAVRKTVEPGRKGKRSDHYQIGGDGEWHTRNRIESPAYGQREAAEYRRRNILRLRADRAGK